MIASFRMVWELLDRPMRGGAFMVLLLTLITAVTDAGSIAVIVPVIRVAMDPAGAMTDPLIEPFVEVLGRPEPSLFVIWVCLALFLFFVAKNGLALLLLWGQQRFIVRNRARISADLVRYYLVCPYLFHLRTNTATLFRNAISAVINLFHGTIQSLFTIVTEGLVAIAILLILVAAEPAVALSVASVMGIAAAAYQHFLRARIVRWGRESYAANEDMAIRFNHAFGSVKETKILGREAYFADAFARAADRHARRLEAFTVLNQSPRMFIEVAGAFGLIAAVATMTLQNRMSEDLVVVMGMFALAAVRLMPSMSRLANAIGNLHFNFALAQELSRDLIEFRTQHRLRQGRPPRLPFTQEITFDNVSFRYPGAAADAVSGINLTIRRGQSVALVGSSGSGKTTVSNVLLGLLTPTDGVVRVDGVEIAGNVRGWQENVGLVPEAVYLIDDTLRRNIAFGVPDEDIDEARLHAVAQTAQLAEVVGSLPDSFNTMVGERGVRLSGGQRQRVAIARCLYHGADVLVMDEATSALDAATEAAIAADIEKLHGDKTIVIIAHRLSTVKNCDRIFFMSDGRVVDSGTFAELASRNIEFRNMVSKMDLSSELTRRPES